MTGCAADCIKGGIRINKLNKKKKRVIVFGSIGGLAAVAAALVSMAAVTAASGGASGINQTESPDNSIEASIGSFIIESHKTDGTLYALEDGLEPQINEIIDDIKLQCGGEWSVYVCVPHSGDTLSINQKKMQAASTIKLFIMGAVYEEYDELVEYYAADDIPELIRTMIEISDNESADLLVTMLGRGNSVKGRKKVTDYCKSLGLNNTSMERMMGDDNIISDNYTSTEDTGKFLEMILNAKLPHSKEMLEYLKNQTRTTKIPEGLPGNVLSANKTGELDDVENDAAIVFAGRPYILCVMSDGVNDYQPPIDAISDISTVTYNYLAPKLVVREVS